LPRRIVRFRARRTLKQMPHRADADDDAQHGANREIEPARVEHQCKRVIHFADSR
jgi:hypothetical protein